VFDNLLGQDASAQLAADMASGSLSPSMLFRGPDASGKGTAALELARALSCEAGAAWNCPCPQCARHRILYHPDLLALGSRSFSPEIAAAARIFSREYGDPTARLLFIRAVRKLLLRFDPLLWEDDREAKRTAPTVESLDADLNEVLSVHERGGAAAPGWAEKIGAAIVKNAWKLEADGLPAQIPVAQIRRASWWCRIAPLGRRKALLIENADRMTDYAQNMLLKILEEPPDTAVIVLCSSRPSLLLPTIRSRLRPYPFHPREARIEREVIRRVFRSGSPAPAPEKAADSPAEDSPVTGSLITAWLDGFLPVPQEKLYRLACFFTASLASQALALLQSRYRISGEGSLSALAAYALPAARDAGLDPAADTASLIQTLGAGSFEAPGLFTGFLSQVLGVISGSRRSEGSPDDAFAEIWSSLAGEAVQAAGVKIAVPLILDRMAAEFLRRVTELYRRAI
jgi:DNA polymerase-3 subunit gamma/tau